MHGQQLTHLFLTGLPGVGKTTIIRRVVASLPSIPISGFYTAEVRDSRGSRVGFEIVTLAGRKAELARVGKSGGPRVGRYVVNVAHVDAVVVPALRPSEPTSLVVVDEVGKMECFSRQFCQAVRHLLDHGPRVLGTVALRGGGFMGEVRRHPNVRLIEVTSDNRDGLPEMIRAQLTREE